MNYPSIVRAFFGGAILVALAINHSSAHNKVAVVPLPDSLDCYIVGAGVDCIGTGKVRVPLGNKVLCDGTLLGSFKYIRFLEAGSLVHFEVGNSNEPRIRTVLYYGGHGDTMSLTIDREPGSIEYIFLQFLYCTPPRNLNIPTLFSAAGHSWEMIPELSTDGTYITLDAIVFERQ